VPILILLPAVIGGRKKERKGRQAGIQRIPSVILAVDSFNTESSKEDSADKIPSRNSNWDTQAEQFLIDSRSRKSTNDTNTSFSSSSHIRKRTATTSGTSASKRSTPNSTPVILRASSPKPGVIRIPLGSKGILIQPNRTSIPPPPSPL
jgi:hypothetical protein